MSRNPLPVLFGILVLAAAVRSEPPTPESYRVYLRYQIHAFGNDRIVQYQDMFKKFKQLGFEIDPRPEGEEEDINATLLTGTIAAKDARDLLLERHTRAVLLAGKDDVRMEN